MESNSQFFQKICHSQQQNLQNFKNIETNTSHNNSSQNLKNEGVVKSQQQVRLGKKNPNNFQEHINESVNNFKRESFCSEQVEGTQTEYLNVTNVNQQQKIQQQMNQQAKKQKLILKLNQEELETKKIATGRQKNQMNQSNYNVQEQNVLFKQVNNSNKLSANSELQQHYLNSINKNKMRQKNSGLKLQNHQKQLQIRLIQTSQIYPSLNNLFQSNSQEIHLELHKKAQNNAELSEQIIDCLLKRQVLPKGFRHLFQIMNISYVFPQLFQFNNQILGGALDFVQQFLNSCKKSVKQDQLNLYNLLNSKNNNIINFGEKLNSLLQEHLRNFMSKIIELMLQDLTHEKLQLLEKFKSYNLICLAKFSKQNQFFQFVFKYNWPLIVLEVVKVSRAKSNINGQLNQSSISVGQKQQFHKSLEYLQNSIQIQNYNTPQNIETFLQIISFLIDSFSRTNIFRDLFNKKIENNRISSKKKNQLQQQKKNIQQNIKKLNPQKNNKTKKIVKTSKKAKSKEQNNGHNKEQGLLSSICQMQRQIQNIMNLIQQQNNEQNLLSCCIYLGKDKNSYIYWFVKHFPYWIFIERHQDIWKFVQLSEIPQFLKLLDISNYYQTKLHEKLNYQHKLYLQKMQKNKPETMDLELDCKANQSIQVLNGKNYSQIKYNSNFQNKKINLQKQVEKILNQNQNYQNQSSRSFLDSHSELTNGIIQFKIDKNSLYLMVQVGQRKMAQYLKQRNSKWGNEYSKQTLLNKIKEDSSTWLKDVKKQLCIFNQKICVVEIQYKVFIQQSGEQVDSKIKKIQTKIWGINERYKHNWYDFIAHCNNFSQLYYAVCILYCLIKKYTSKNRKLRKQYEEIKQKTIWLNTNAKKQQIRNSWNEKCQVCGQGGEVLCCDMCPKVYHLLCLNLDSIPEEKFKCKSCTEQLTTRNQLKSISQNKKSKNK